MPLKYIYPILFLQSHYNLDLQSSQIYSLNYSFFSISNGLFHSVSHSEQQQNKVAVHVFFTILPCPARRSRRLPGRWRRTRKLSSGLLRSPAPPEVPGRCTRICALRQWDRPPPEAFPGSRRHTSLHPRWGRSRRSRCQIHHS